MAKSAITVWTDDEVGTQVRSIIRDAKKHVELVTPYLDLWGHIKDEIGLAVKRGVKVTAVVRLERKVLTHPDVPWLTGIGVNVLLVDRLHAKIYLNEEVVLVSSMNLNESSSTNSKEIALLISDDDIERKVRDYVKNTLRPLGMSIAQANTAVLDQHVATNFSSSPKQSGHCVRCGRKIVLDPSKPLCENCYGEWAQWGNPDYQEKICHVCGKPASVSYAKPLCASCFRKS